jgi:phage baseplate assembly protein V
MKLPDFKRLIRPITNKIFLLLGRAVLKAINNSEKTQKIQVLALSGEVITDIEHFQSYGFEHYPWEEAESFIGFLNGNRDHGIALIVHDGRYRPLDLSQGEVCIYTDEDKTNPFRITMKRGRIAEIKCRDFNVIATNNINLSADGDVTITAGNDITETATGNHATNATRIDHN